MTALTDNVATVAAELAAGVTYGSTARYDVGDACYYLARVEHDEWESGFDHINGCDAYGRVAWVERDRDTGSNRPRPDGFTGAAVKLHTSRGDNYWWEPYREGRKVYASCEDRALVRDLVEYGPQVVIVERWQVLACGDWHRVEQMAMGGVEPFADEGYLASVIADLLSEMEGDAE